MPDDPARRGGVRRSGGTKTIHRGSHPAYTAHVKKRLKEIEADAQAEVAANPSKKICDVRARKVKALQKELKADLKAGTLKRPDGSDGLNDADPSMNRPKKKKKKKK